MSNRFAHHLRQQEMATRETQVSGVNTRCSPNHLRQWHNAASQASDEIPRYSCFEVVQLIAAAQLQLAGGDGLDPRRVGSWELETLYKLQMADRSDGY